MSMHGIHYTSSSSWNDGKIKKREQIEYPFNVLLMRTLETMLKGDVPPND